MTSAESRALEELGTLLSEAEAGDDTALRTWQRYTPQEYATEQLHRIVTQGMPLSRGKRIVVACMMLLGLSVTGVVFSWFGLFASLIFFSVALLGSSHLFQKVGGKGRYAIFLLLKQGDPLAVVRLVSVWQVSSRASDLGWREKTTQALVQALDAEPSPRAERDTQARLRTLVEVLLFPSRVRRRRDLNDSETDVLASALRYLHRARGPENQALLARCAALPRFHAQPNRVLVCEVAESLALPGNLQTKDGAPEIEPVEDAALVAIAIPSSMAAPQAQTLYRS